MRSNNLVPLLTNKADINQFRQGTILSWDPDTAENSVSVAGSVLTNLPILNTTEASLLTAGDAVSCVKWGASFAILGRIVTPGANAVSAIQAVTNRFQAAEDAGIGTRNSTTYGDLSGTNIGPEVTVRIGSSGRAVAFWSCEMGQVTTTPGGSLAYESKITPHVGVQLTGANSVSPSNENALNMAIEFPASGFAGHATPLIWIQAATFHLFSGLTPGNTTFTMKYRHDGLTPSAGVQSNFQSRELLVIAL